MKTFSGFITSLKPNEVFVFGANLNGFHGAGAAGFATFGQPGNVWRKYGYDKWPRGKQGNWTEKGKTGFQEGTKGKSYGLPTVTRPGQRRSLDINFTPLFECCQKHPELTFYYAQTAESSLNGWTVSEIVNFIKQSGEIPENLVFHESLAYHIEKSLT
jgi:hypothetical protein